MSFVISGDLRDRTASALQSLPTDACTWSIYKSFQRRIDQVLPLKWKPTSRHNEEDDRFRKEERPKKPQNSVRRTLSQKRFIRPSCLTREDLTHRPLIVTDHDDLVFHQSIFLSSNLSRHHKWLPNSSQSRSCATLRLLANPPRLFDTRHIFWYWRGISNRSRIRFFKTRNSCTACMTMDGKSLCFFHISQ